MKFCTLICTKEQMEKAGYKLREVEMISTEFMNLINAGDIEKGDLVYDLEALKLYQVDSDLSLEQWIEDTNDSDKCVSQSMIEYCERQQNRIQTLHINPIIDEEWQKDTIYGTAELEAKKRRLSREKQTRRQSGLGGCVPSPTQTQQQPTTNNQQQQETKMNQAEQPVFKTYLKDNCVVTLDHITYGYTSQYEIIKTEECIRLHQDLQLCKSNQPEKLDPDYDIPKPKWDEFGVEYKPTQLSSDNWQNIYILSL